MNCWMHWTKMGCWYAMNFDWTKTKLNFTLLNVCFRFYFDDKRFFLIEEKIAMNFYFADTRRALNVRNCLNYIQNKFECYSFVRWISIWFMILEGFGMIKLVYFPRAWYTFDGVIISTTKNNISWKRYAYSLPEEKRIGCPHRPKPLTRHFF